MENNENLDERMGKRRSYNKQGDGNGGEDKEKNEGEYDGYSNDGDEKKRSKRRSKNDHVGRDYKCTF